MPACRGFCPAAAILRECRARGARPLYRQPCRLPKPHRFLAAPAQAPLGFWCLCPAHQPAGDVQARPLCAGARDERDPGSADAQTGASNPCTGFDQQCPHSGAARAETRPADRRRLHGDHAGADLARSGAWRGVRQRDALFDVHSQHLRVLLDGDARRVRAAHEARVRPFLDARARCLAANAAV